MITENELRVTKDRVPVDVEFESLLRVLVKSAFLLSKNPSEFELQKAFCQELRECKLAF